MSELMMVIKIAAWRTEISPDTEQDQASVAIHPVPRCQQGKNHCSLTGHTHGMPGLSSEMNSPPARHPGRQ